MQCDRMIQSVSADALDWLVPRFLTSSALPFWVSLETFAALRACADSDLGNFALQLHCIHTISRAGWYVGCCFHSQGPAGCAFQAATTNPGAHRISCVTCVPPFSNRVMLVAGTPHRRR